MLKINRPKSNPNNSKHCRRIFVPKANHNIKNRAQYFHPCMEDGHLDNHTDKNKCCFLINQFNNPL